MSQEVKLEFLGEVETMKVSPGDLILVKIIGCEDITEVALSALRDNFKQIFPNNKALVMSLPEGDISFSVISQEQLAAALDDGTDHTVS